MTTTKTSRFTHFDELLAVRMGTPEFILSESALPQIESDTTSVYVAELLELGFIFSHELAVTHAVGKDEGEISGIIAYIKADESAYALVTNLYHEDCWVHFTSLFSDGSRFITTSQPGVLALEQLPIENRAHHLQNLGSAPLSSQWKRHKRFIATEVPEKSPLLVKPEQHVELEKQFYQSLVAELLQQNILQQSDTQTVRFTRSGARNFHLALTSRSAKRPAPRVAELIAKSSELPAKGIFNFRNLALAASALVGIGLIGILQQSKDTTAPPVTDETARVTESTEEREITAGGDGVDLSLQLPDPDAITSGTIPPDSNTEPDIEPPSADRQKYLIANQEDEMWRIAVENAEFFLLSNDGDPAPWIRTARKIAAGFNSSDSRLARTYFLAALLEPDFRIAEQQFNRALSIQTKTLGLYHAETAQTLEALAWIAEHNKDDLDEAITHQRLAINIYHDIFGPDAEDTKAAEWKLAYFEDRLAGLRPKADSNRRLLPALARFSR